MHCLFCAIIKKEIPAEMVHEDEHTFAFLDIHPHAPGHTLVIPRVHAPTLLALPEDEVGPLFKTVKRMTEKLLAALGPSGFTIGMNHGRVSGQEVDHLHVHILPRFSGDGGGSVQGVVAYEPKKSLAEIANSIRIQK